MVLKIKFPKGISCSRLIENVVADRYRLPRVPFKRYYTPAQVSTLIGIPEHRILHLAARSDIIHGAEWNGALYLHPEGVSRYVKRKYQQYVSRQNKKFGKIPSEKEV